MIDLDYTRKTGMACKHCGNAVLTYKGCPMRFPKPDCWTDADAAQKAVDEARWVRAGQGKQA